MRSGSNFANNDKGPLLSSHRQPLTS